MKKLSTEIFIKRAKDVHGSEYDYNFVCENNSGIFNPDKKVAQSFLEKNITELLKYKKRKDFNL